MITVRKNLFSKFVTFTFAVDINPDDVEEAATDEALRDKIITGCLNAYRNDLYMFLKEGKHYD